MLRYVRYDIASHAKFWARFHERNVLEAQIFFRLFYMLNVFNHVASLACDVIEITNEKNDGLFEKNPRDTKEI